MNNSVDFDRMRRVHENYEKNLNPELDRRIKEHIGGMYRDDLIVRKEVEQTQLDKERYISIDDEIEDAKLKSRDVMAKIRTEKRNRQVTIYKRAIALALGGLGVAISLVKTPIGGKMMNVVKVPINSIIDKDNERLENEYQHTIDEVEELTGMTPEEIMEKGKSIK